jgi:S1-C subfamily serine protease
VLSVLRVTAGAPSADLLEPGDLLLAVQDRPVTRFGEVEHAAQSPEIEVTILRDGVERRLRVPTQALDGRGTDRAVFWAGALLQAPHHAIAAQYNTSLEGVYVSWLWYGSPAHRYELSATRRIVAVDDEPVADLDAFLAAVADRPDRSSVRLRTIGLEGRAGVITLKLDLEFWPTSELRRNGTEWEHLQHRGAAAPVTPES